MKMLFVVGIEMSKVQSRRHCQFEGGGGILEGGEAARRCKA